MANRGINSLHTILIDPINQSFILSNTNVPATEIAPMLLAPIPFVPSDESEGPNFNFHTPHPGLDAIRLVCTAVFRLSVFFIALCTALLGQGYWGQGVGKIGLFDFEERFSLTQLGCLLVMVTFLCLKMVVLC